MICLCMFCFVLFWFSFSEYFEIGFVGFINFGNSWTLFSPPQILFYFSFINLSCMIDYFIFCYKSLILWISFYLFLLFILF
jgi:hypothetical protein